MWLQSIHARLAGRVAIRKPYYAEIRRNIPYNIYVIVRQVVKDLEIDEPKCFIGINRKAEVISFTSVHALSKLLALMSGMNTKDIKKFFTRTLKGARTNHKVKLIASEKKDFALVYKKTIGQLIIQFYYGEWNVHGFPQH